MATANPPASATLVGEQQDQRVTALRTACQVATGVLLLLAGAKIVTSVLLIFTTTIVALLGVVEGALIALLALILIKIATDLRFALAVPRLSAIHFVHALDSWRDFCKTLIGVAVVALLAALARSAA